MTAWKNRSEGWKGNNNKKHNIHCPDPSFKKIKLRVTSYFTSLINNNQTFILSDNILNIYLITLSKRWKVVSLHFVRLGIWLKNVTNDTAFKNVMIKSYFSLLWYSFPSRMTAKWVQVPLTIKCLKLVDLLIKLWNNVHLKLCQTAKRVRPGAGVQTDYIEITVFCNNK